MAPSRDRRPGFSRRAQYGLFVTWVLGIAGALVGAALLALSLFNPTGFAAVRSGVAEVTVPVSAAMAWVARGVVAVPQAIGGWIDVHGENERLRARVQRSAGALMAGRAAMLENARLRRLVAFRERDATVVAVTRIVSTSSSSTRRYGLLNAGRWQGVEEGQPVRGPEGLIGRVLEAGPGTARVLLLTDPESVVPVRRLRDGRAALAAGRGDGLVDIRTIDTADGKFRAGDVYVTTGVGGIYTPGVPVAQGLAAGTDSAPARPFARPDSLDVAMVSRQYFAPPPPAPAAAPTPAPVPAPAPTRAP
ncbi:rod shape-determining protein MreC [Sphingomonas sp. Leaf412]|uniref:rod shape-determining protein MreC n=1 Tax=Sphingomonas sp. Leaf412 TaxID=1736370 RepID=UPI0006F6E9A6|nr:rod shape-determining protein MreC [Sphingomonas sp. Leaf412]KQT32102.1 rod shape-determining protein MreC [Sphingomonas sp. Leaf412]